MYYEAIHHARRNVENAESAARLIHECIELHDYDAICWMSDNRTFCAVADGGLERPWFEVAVIDLDNMIQIESITFGWCKSLREKILCLKKCETTHFRMGKTRFPLDGEGLDELAHFTCGCCGSWFESTPRLQRRFDQDAGHGICQQCERYY